LDSLSHLWSGKGGIQDQVDAAGKRYKGIMAWNQVKPNIENLLHTLTANSIYIISTARSKTSYDMETNDKGKVVPIKSGLKPEIRDGWDYEFAINFDINHEHVATAAKDNTNMFDTDAPITKETGYKIFEWSSEGVDPEEERQTLISKVQELFNLNDDNKALIVKGEHKLNTKFEDWNRKQLRNAIANLHPVNNITPMSPKQNDDSNFEEVPSNESQPKQEPKQLSMEEQLARAKQRA